MHTLTKIAVPALLASLALGAAMPAQAYTPARAETIRHEIADLQQAVNRLDRRDRISPREAAGLKREVHQLSQQFRSYNRNGLSRVEYRTLARRIDALRARLRDDRSDRTRHRR